MKTEWRNVGEAVAALAVIVSLIFVGIELRQNTRASTAEARVALSNQSLDWLRLITTDEVMHDLWVRGWQQADPIEDFTATEVTRASGLMRINLRRLENVYLQYEQGVVDGTAFESYGFPTNEYQAYTSERFKNYWQSNKSGFNPNFTSFFETRVGIGD